MPCSSLSARSAPHASPPESPRHSTPAPPDDRTRSAPGSRPALVEARHDGRDAVNLIETQTCFASSPSPPTISGERFRPGLAQRHRTPLQPVQMLRLAARRLADLRFARFPQPQPANPRHRAPVAIGQLQLRQALRPRHCAPPTHAPAAPAPRSQPATPPTTRTAAAANRRRRATPPPQASAHAAPHPAAQDAARTRPPIPTAPPAAPPGRTPRHRPATPPAAPGTTARSRSPAACNVA